MSHALKKCPHGEVVSQCRCMGPKDVVTVACTDRCLKKHGEMLPADGGYVGKHLRENSDNEDK